MTSAIPQRNLFDICLFIVLCDPKFNPLKIIVSMESVPVPIDMSVYDVCAFVLRPGEVVEYFWTRVTNVCRLPFVCWQ